MAGTIEVTRDGAKTVHSVADGFYITRGREKQLRIKNLGTKTVLDVSWYDVELGERLTQPLPPKGAMDLTNEPVKRWNFRIFRHSRAKEGARW